ncbi:777_t:CDS:2 [Cetraspora pellucida]|uniref:777_t:CDS:1 n=1 Tax=Cetraspora pellucida TaxID=1433469 RepID=A0ACA9NBZ7_9GLOM|nr:777_t:CDS:2 [Cetraspora pellucida]
MSSHYHQNFKELRQSVGEDEATCKISQNHILIEDIVNNILSCIQNLESPEFIKTAATQMFKKVQKYANEIYDKTVFIAAILDP